ncbi:DUF2179 domain-containing protein [Metabacillus litoralis]
MGHRCTCGLYRGTTMWDANGGYTNNKKIILCCI